VLLQLALCVLVLELKLLLLLLLRGKKVEAVLRVQLVVVVLAVPPRGEDWVIHYVRVHHGSLPNVASSGRGLFDGFYQRQRKSDHSLRFGAVVFVTPPRGRRHGGVGRIRRLADAPSRRWGDGQHSTTTTDTDEATADTAPTTAAATANTARIANAANANNSSGGH